jgi:hypothetical protein
LIFLIPYKENEITSNSNENSQEKILVNFVKTFNQKLSKQKRDQPFKVFLHFNNTIEKNNITNNNEFRDRENDTSHINIKFITEQKETARNFIHTKNISKNEKNYGNKNQSRITMDQKANRSRRMSQRKYMCYCKQANCKGRQCLHEQIQHHYPWEKTYFPNVKEYIEDEYEEDSSTEKIDKPDANSYKTIKTYVKNIVPTPTEPTKFSIPFANNVNFDQRVMVGNENPLIKQQSNQPNIFYSNPQIKLQKNEALLLSKYDPHNVLHNKMTYPEITPMEQNQDIITNSQSLGTNNYIPSVFGKSFPNIDECIRLYGRNVCINSSMTKTSYDKIKSTNLSNNVPIESYSNDKNNNDREYYIKTSSESGLLYPNKLNEKTKSNDNLNIDNYSAKEIIKNENKENNDKNIKKNYTYLLDNKNNYIPIKDPNTEGEYHVLNDSNSYNQNSTPTFYINNINTQTPLQLYNMQQQLTQKSSESYNKHNINNDLDFITDNNTFLNKSNKNNSNEKLVLTKSSDHSVNLYNNQNFESKNNNYINGNEFLQKLFHKNDTKISLKEIEQDNLRNDNILNLVKKNNSKNYERNAIKLDMNPDSKNMKTTQKPFYGQVRRSTTERDKKLIKSDNENKLTFPDINISNLNKNKKLNNVNTFVQSVDENLSNIYESDSEFNSLNYNNENDAILNSNVPSDSLNIVTQAYNNINDDKILIMNTNTEEKLNNNFKNKQDIYDVSIQDKSNEILLKNALTKIINNFVPGKAQDLIANYDKENNQIFINTNTEDILPEILNIPVLRNLFFAPEVENMIADTAKKFIYQITGSSPNNVQIIKNMLRNIVEKIFLPDSTISSTTMNENIEWVTNNVTLSEKSQNLATPSNTSKKIFNKIQSIINYAAIGEKDAKRPVIKNLIVKTVKHSLDKETGTIDELTIRQAFDLLIHQKVQHSSNLVVSTKVPLLQNKMPFEHQPNTITSNNNDYKMESKNSIKEHILQNRHLIKLEKNLDKNERDDNFEVKRNKQISSQVKLDNIQYRKIKPEDQSEHYGQFRQPQTYFNIQNVEEDPEKLKTLSKKPINYTFSNEKIRNKYIRNIELSKLDDSIEREPIKYFTPNDRILEYIKNHQNSDYSNLETVANITGHTDEYNMDKETRQINKKIPTVIINYNTSEMNQNPINALNSKQSILQFNPKTEQQTLDKNPSTLSMNKDKLNGLVRTNDSVVSENQMPRNTQSKTNNTKMGNNTEIIQTNDKLNQIVDVPRNKFVQPLSLNEHNINSSPSQNLTYLGKLVPVNSHQIETEQLNNLQDSKLELVYVGDGVRLPLTIKKLEDGTLALMLSDDICKQCIQKNCSRCPSNISKQVIVRERRSDETVPIINFIDKQHDIKESAITWLIETFAKANNLIPNLTSNNELTIESQKFTNANDESKVNSNMHRMRRESAEIIDTIASNSEKFLKVNEFMNKRMKPNYIPNKNKEITLANTSKKKLNNNTISINDSPQVISKYIDNENSNKQIDINEHEQEILENNINQIEDNNEVRDENKNNKNHFFTTKFDYEMSNPNANELSQTENNINSISGGPPYKYQRYANEDVIVSKRTKTLKNVLHFMKDLIINIPDSS